MDILKICGATLICAICCMILKKFDGPFSSSASIICTVLLAAAAMGAVGKIVSFVSETSAGMPMAPYLPCVWKSVGVMFVTEYSAQVCEEAGEVNLAKALCIAGRIEMTVIALPLFSELASLASGLMGG